jgi:hypothetical protein
VKTVQKLELYSGVAALFAAIFQLLFSTFVNESSEVQSLSIILIFAFIVLIFPVSIIFTGAYMHAVKRNNTGFGILLFFGSLFICFWGYFIFFGLLIGSASKFYTVSMISLILPSFFVGCTMIFAIIYKLSNQKDAKVSLNSQ